MATLLIRPNHYDNIEIKGKGSSNLLGRISNDTCTVSTISVDSLFLRSGIGSQMYALFEEKALSSNIKLIVIQVFRFNHKALNFWSMQGFSIHLDIDEDYLEMTKSFS